MVITGVIVTATGLYSVEVGAGFLMIEHGKVRDISIDYL